jgi:hypothetical protein
METVLRLTPTAALLTGPRRHTGRVPMVAALNMAVCLVLAGTGCTGPTQPLASCEPALGAARHHCPGGFLRACQVAISAPDPQLVFPLTVVCHTAGG